MAGLGFKDFAVGEVLTAADVDGYLMQQSVMRFADSAARGSALGTAVLAEGMVTYLDDLNQVQRYDGSAWSAVSRVLQVLEATTTTTTTTSSTSYVDTALSATITPSSTSSTIVALCSVEKISSANTGTTGTAKLFRDATALTNTIERVDTGTNYGATIFEEDAPASTSALTYKLRLVRSGGADNVSVSGYQSLVVMEVAG